MDTDFTTECPSWCQWAPGQHEHAIDLETSLPLTEHGRDLGRWKQFAILRTREDREAWDGSVLSVEKVTLFWDCNEAAVGLPELRALARMVTAAADEFEEASR